MTYGPLLHGQSNGANILLALVPHETPHGIMKHLEHLCMLLLKVLKVRAIKDTMALVAHSKKGISMCDLNIEPKSSEQMPRLSFSRGTVNMIV